MIDFESNPHWPPHGPPSPPHEQGDEKDEQQPQQPSSFPSDILVSLRQHPLFQRTNNESFLAQLVSNMHVRHYNPRDVIITQGEASKAMFFLLRGQVEVCSADGERIYATLNGGACFGEIGILYSRPRTATVVAAVKCTVAALTAHQVHSLLPRFPQVEKVIRYEAQERLALLEKAPSTTTTATTTLSDKGSNDNEVERPLRSSVQYNVEAFGKTGIRNYLTKIPFFFGCSEDFLHLICLSVQFKTYGPKTLLIQQGEHGDKMYFIVEGSVDLTTQTNESYERLGPGGHFGDSAVLLDHPYAATVRTVTQVEAYQLNRTDLQHVCDLFPDTCARLKQMAQEKLHKVAKQQDLSSSLSPTLDDIPLQSVCRTTCDQDPMTPATQLRATETRRRRASVAVWNDPFLSEVARKTAPLDNTKKPPLSLPPLAKLHTTTKIRPSDRFSSHPHLILPHVLLHLDYKTTLQVMRLNRTIHNLMSTGSIPQPTVDLSTLHKRINDETFRYVIPRLHQPHSLSLSHCFHLTDQGIQALWQTENEHQQQQTALTSLDLNSCWLLTDQTLQRLGEYCTNLRRLDLSNCRKITTKGLARLVDAHQDLTWLSLSYCKNLTDQTLHHLAQCRHTLTYLNLQRCTKITDAAFTALNDDEQEVGLFTHLREVVLVDCSFLTDRAIDRLVRGAPYLERLNVSFCCALSDSVMPHLARLLRLRDLDLSFCGAAVSDLSLQALAPLSCLERLNLRGCMRITGDGVLDFITARPSLISLNVSQCPNISMEVKKRIADRRLVQHLSI